MQQSKVWQMKTTAFTYSLAVKWKHKKQIKTVQLLIFWSCLRTLSCIRTHCCVSLLYSAHALRHALHDQPVKIQEAVSGNAPHNSVPAMPEKSSSDMWTEQLLKRESRKHRKVWKTRQAEESYKSVVRYWCLSQIVWCMILLYNYCSSSYGTLTRFWLIIR